MRMVFPSQSSGRLMDDLASDVGTLVESLFSDAVDRGRSKVKGNETCCAPGQSRMPVPLDVDESDDAYLVTLDVPGVALESIEIDVHEDTLTIVGQRDVPKQSDGSDTGDTDASHGGESETATVTLKHRRRERAFGKFHRKIQLPLPVESDAVSAELADGVLIVSLPKADPEKGKRRVPIARA